MHLKLFVALFTGGLGYIITVLVSLVLQQPLSLVLKKGIITFVLLFIGAWSLTFCLEHLNTQKEKKENREEQEEQIAVTEEDEETDEMNKEDGEEKDGDFSPINPPVLEVEDENQ